MFYDQQHNTSEFSESFALNQGSIEGTVHDQNGPVEGSIVHLESNSNGQFTDIQVATDADGNVRFERLRAGVYTVRQEIGQSVAQAVPAGRFVQATVTTSACESTPSLVRAVVAGDFDRDGFDDLAYVRDRTGELVILRNNGLGEFESHETLTAGDRPQSIMIMDIDHDLDLDLIVANAGSNEQTSSVVVFENQNGTFRRSHQLRSGDGSIATAAGDFDLDGDDDLAVVNFRSRTVSLFTNDSGQFERAKSILLVSQPITINASDLDGDGRIDLLVGTDTGVVRLSNMGELGFDTSSLIHVNGGVSFLDVVDWNRDGIDEIAVAEFANNAISLFTTDGKSIMSKALSPGARPHFLTFADVDADGANELLVAEGETNTVSVFERDIADPVHRIRTAASETGCGGGPQWVSAGQFTNDSNPDIVTSSLNAEFRVFNYSLGSYQIELAAGQSVKELEFVNFNSARPVLHATSADVLNGGMVSRSDAALATSHLDQDRPAILIAKRRRAFVSGEDFLGRTGFIDLANQTRMQSLPQLADHDVLTARRIDSIRDDNSEFSDDWDIDSD